MNRARRWVAGGAVLIATGSCIERAPAPPVIAAAPPTPRPAPRPPGDFSLKGNQTQGGMLLGTAPAGTVTLTLDGVPVPVAPEGDFVIAFDRDAGTAATLSAMRDDGVAVVRTLVIAPRAWAVSRLSGLPKYPVPPADFARLRPAELAQINAARAGAGVEADGWRQPLLWPATGRISTLFGSQRIYRGGAAGAYHSGIDIAVPQGTPVLAPADGVVTLASDHPFLLEGNLLLVDHGMKLESAFMHLSQILVAPGQRVRRGQVIAYSGATGRVTGAHLHWSLRWRGAKIDPLLAAGPMPTGNRPLSWPGKSPILTLCGKRVTNRGQSSDTVQHPALLTSSSPQRSVIRFGWRACDRCWGDASGARGVCVPVGPDLGMLPS